nr:hypothetical protein Q903MT_gene3451 [Picea sitchensis]
MVGYPVGLSRRRLLRTWGPSPLGYQSSDGSLLSYQSRWCPCPLRMYVGNGRRRPLPPVGARESLSFPRYSLE